MYDIYHDPHCSRLYDISSKVKLPRYVEEFQLPETPYNRNLYAWPEKQACPIATPADTYLSIAYQLLAEDKHSIPSTHSDRLMKSASYHAIEGDIVDLFEGLQPKPEHVKYAFQKDTPKGAIKLFPLTSKQSWRYAQDTFSENPLRYPPIWREKIAKSLVDTQQIFAPEEDLSFPVEAHAKVAFCIPGVLVEEIHVRSDEAHSRRLPRLALSLRKVAHRVDNDVDAIMDTMFLSKVAAMLSTVDETLGLLDRYNRPFRLPHEAVWNTPRKQIEKLANYVDIEGDVYDPADLEPHMGDITDLVGSDFGEAIASDPSAIGAILETLPRDLRYLVKAMLKEKGVPSREEV